MNKAYPTYFKDFNPEDFEVQAKLWQRSLTDHEYRDVVNAFEIWLNTEKYPPSLASLSLWWRDLKTRTPFYRLKAWELVTTAVRKYGSYNQNGLRYLFGTD